MPDRFRTTLLHLRLLAEVAASEVAVGDLTGWLAELDARVHDLLGAAEACAGDARLLNALNVLRARLGSDLRMVEATLAEARATLAFVAEL